MTTEDTRLQVPAPWGSWATVSRRTRAGHPETEGQPSHAVTKAPGPSLHRKVHSCRSSCFLQQIEGSSLAALLQGWGDVRDRLSQEKCFPFLFIFIHSSEVLDTGLNLSIHTVSFHIKNDPEEDHRPVSLQMKWKEAGRRRLPSPE